MESLVILQALSHIKEQWKGQNLENVVSHCCKEFDWERPKVLRAVNHATKDELISQASKDDVVLLRISDMGHQVLRNPTASVDTSVKGTSQSTADESDFDTDYLDFKKYIHAEVLSLKALMSNRTISAPEKNANNPRIDYETNFIKSLQDRILSLERQLDQKQEIIKKLLEGKELNKPSPIDAKIPTGPAMNTEAQSRSDKEKKGPMINNTQQSNKTSATAAPFTRYRFHFISDWFHIGLAFCLHDTVFISYRIGLLFTRERTNPICFIPFSRFQMKTL